MDVVAAVPSSVLVIVEASSVLVAAFPKQMVVKIKKMHQQQNSTKTYHVWMHCRMVLSGMLLIHSTHHVTLLGLWLNHLSTLHNLNELKVNNELNLTHKLWLIYCVLWMNELLQSAKASLHNIAWNFFHHMHKKTKINFSILLDYRCQSIHVSANKLLYGNFKMEIFCNQRELNLICTV